MSGIYRWAFENVIPALHAQSPLFLPPSTPCHSAVDTKAERDSVAGEWGRRGKVKRRYQRVLKSVVWLSQHDPNGFPRLSQQHEETLPSGHDNFSLSGEGGSGGGGIINDKETRSWRWIMCAE